MGCRYIPTYTVKRPLYTGKRPIFTVDTFLRTNDLRQNFGQKKAPLSSRRTGAKSSVNITQKLGAAVFQNLKHDRLPSRLPCRPAKLRSSGTDILFPWNGTTPGHQPHNERLPTASPGASYALCRRSRNVIPGTPLLFHLKAKFLIPANSGSQTR